MNDYSIVDSAFFKSCLADNDYVCDIFFRQFIGNTGISFWPYQSLYIKWQVNVSEYRCQKTRLIGGDKDHSKS